jgi:antitoxin VapB
MNKPVHTRTFKSGNSVAVRLPKGFAIPAGAEVELSKTGNRVIISVTEYQVEAKRRLIEMLDALDALPRPPKVQKREPIEFPDRPGLYGRS